MPDRSLHPSMTHVRKELHELLKEHIEYSNIVWKTFKTLARLDLPGLTHDKCPLLHPEDILQQGNTLTPIFRVLLYTNNVWFPPQ